jgi:hypothetical protein
MILLDQPMSSCKPSRVHQTVIARWLSLVAIFGSLTVFGASALAKGAVNWKPIEDALLQVNDGPVKDWGVYQAGKKTDPLLLQMGKRFLLIQIHDRQIFEVDPAKVEQKSPELLWNPSDRPALPLATSDWESREIGGATRISVKLDADSRALELELPHEIDPNSLPTRLPNRHR